MRNNTYFTKSKRRYFFIAPPPPPHPQDRTARAWRCELVPWVAGGGEGLRRMVTSKIEPCIKSVHVWGPKFLFRVLMQLCIRIGVHHMCYDWPVKKPLLDQPVWLVIYWVHCGSRTTGLFTTKANDDATSDVNMMDFMFRISHSWLPVILLPLRCASLMHKNPQRRKIIHGIYLVGLKGWSVDLRMLLYNILFVWFLRLFLWLLFNNEYWFVFLVLYNWTRLYFKFRKL